MYVDDRLGRRSRARSGLDQLDVAEDEAAPAPEKVPASHLMHVSSPAPRYLPASQISHVPATGGEE